MVVVLWLLLYLPHSPLQSSPVFLSFRLCLSGFVLWFPPFLPPPPPPFPSSITFLFSPPPPHSPSLSSPSSPHSQDSLRSNALTKIISVFQDSGDEQFLKRLREANEERKNASSERAAEDEEGGSAASAVAVAEEAKWHVENGGLDVKPLAAEATAVWESAAKAKNMTLDQKVKATKEKADKFAKAGIIVSGGFDAGTAADPAASLSRDLGSTFKPSGYSSSGFVLPSHIDRPPSPIVFARTVGKLKVAVDVPPGFLARAARRAGRGTEEEEGERGEGSGLEERGEGEGREKKGR